MNNFKSGGEKTEEYIKKMQDASSRMMALINDLLAFSRISNESVEFQKTDLNVIIEQVKEDLDSVANTKNVQVFIDPLPTCMVIPSQMQQLFQNLLTNAIKFNDKTVPEIHVTCEKIVSNLDNRVDYKISVRDNGIGFSPAYKERIFDIFQRIHGRAQYGGSGIGLAICKKIMEAHKGSITADAVEGEGAVFTFILPEHQY